MKPTLLLRGSRDGKTAQVFHKLCDNKGPLLILFKTRMDILCGGFSSVDWQSSGDWTVDTKCFIFSLKLRKIYRRQNDNKNINFNKSYGPCFGTGANLGLSNSNKLYSNCNKDPFHVPETAEGVHEITEEKDGQYEFKDYEVFAIS